MDLFKRFCRSKAALLGPPLALALGLWLWTVNVFNWDEWIIWYNGLERLRDGSFGLLDLVRQQNEHRNLAARLVGVLFYPFFHLDRNPEYVMLFGMAGVCFLLAARLYRRTAGPDAVSDRRPLLAFSALTFSFLQWETFSFGINASVLMPVFALWMGAALLWLTPRLSPVRLFGLAGVGIIGSFSFANGLFLWPCLAPLVALRAGSRQRAYRLTGLWLAIGLATWSLYFTGYIKPPHHPGPIVSLESPLTCLGYFLAYLAGAIVGDRTLLPVAMLAGAFALVLLYQLVRAGWKEGGQTRENLWPWLAVAGFTLLSAMATAAGRSRISLGQALESRYATFTTPFWLALAALYYLHGHRLPARLRPWFKRGVALCMTLFLMSSVLAAIVLHNRKARLEASRQELYSLAQPQRLRTISPDPAFIVTTMPVFLEQRAGFYSGLPRDTAFREGTPCPGTASLQPADLLDRRVHGFLLTGTAPGQAAQRLVVRLGSRVVGLGKVDPDGTWQLFLPENALPKGSVSPTVAILDRDGTTLHPLTPPPGLHGDNPGRSTTDFRLEHHFFVPGVDWDNRHIPSVFPAPATP